MVEAGASEVSEEEILGRNVGIDGKRGSHDRHVVEKALGEQRADRTVDKPRREYRLVAASALAALEATGDLAYRIRGSHGFRRSRLRRRQVRYQPRHRTARKEHDIPGRGAFAMVTFVITTVSPQRMIHDPLACPAYLPVSTMTLRPPISFLRGVSTTLRTTLKRIRRTFTRAAVFCKW